MWQRPGAVVGEETRGSGGVENSTEVPRSMRVASRQVDAGSRERSYRPQMSGRDRRFLPARPGGKSSRPKSALNGRAGRQRTGSGRVQSPAYPRVSVPHLAGRSTLTTLGPPHGGYPDGRRRGTVNVVGNRSPRHSVPTRWGGVPPRRGGTLSAHLHNSEERLGGTPFAENAVGDGHDEGRIGGAQWVLPRRPAGLRPGRRGFVVPDSWTLPDSESYTREGYR